MHHESAERGENERKSILASARFCTVCKGLLLNYLPARSYVVSMFTAWRADNKVQALVGQKSQSIASLMDCIVSHPVAYTQVVRV